MDKDQAQFLAESLMKEHGLGKKWKFKWIRSYHKYGQCDWMFKEIRLSKPFVKVNEEFEVRNTILHELAHAKCHKHGHNKFWKAWCIKLGARPCRIDTCANRPRKD